MVFGVMMIGIQQANSYRHTTGDRKPESQILTTDDGFGCVQPPRTTAELMKATHQRRTAGAYETTGAYKNNCVAQTTRRRRETSGYGHKKKDGKGGSVRVE
jgi:hypothetical protein